MFISLSPSLLSLPRPILSHSAPSTTFPQSESTSTLPIAFCSPLWPSEALCQSGASVLSMRSFLTFLRPFISLWTSSGAAISLLGLSGSSGSCLGEFSSPLHSNRSLTRSDAVLGFLGQFPVSSTLPDAPNASVLAPVSSFSELVTPFASPSSSTLKGLSGRYMGLSGGGGSSGGLSGTSSSTVSLR